MRPGVGDAAGDRLADPPRGVRRELEALAPVELLDGVHQAEVALLDQVEQRQARRLVLLGDRHHETQVRLHELALGLLALTGGAAQFALLGGGDLLAAGVERLDRLLAAFDRFREPDLVVLREQRVLTDIGQIQADQVFVVSFDTIFGHGGSWWVGVWYALGETLAISVRLEPSDPPTNDRSPISHRGSTCRTWRWGYDTDAVKRRNLAGREPFLYRAFQMPFRRSSGRRSVHLH